MAASRTAEFMALFRALDERGVRGEPIVGDRLARHFLRPGLRLVAAAARVPGIARIVRDGIDRRWPGARTSGVARTRLIDDALRTALAGGVGQVVILGAGFDARAYRIAGIERARVVEVDRPEMVAAKRAALVRALGTLPPHVTFVGADFRRENTERALASAGIDPERRTFFIWEGVTNYLTADAVDAMLAVVARAAAGSEIAFTYVERRAVTDLASYPGGTEIARTLARSGESWTFGLDPAELPAFLDRRGFALVEDVGSVEYRRRYLLPRTLRLRGYEFYRVARARVTGEGACPR
jgi:methyltransferase (TIGR00027 family)